MDLGGLVATSKAPDLSLKARPKRDRKEPFRFRVHGDLTGPFIVDDAVCTGEVVVRTKPKITKKKTVDLELAAGVCTYDAKLKGTKGGKARLIANFEGNGSLTPAKVKKKVRAG